VNMRFKWVFSIRVILGNITEHHTITPYCMTILSLVFLTWETSYPPRHHKTQNAKRKILCNYFSNQLEDSVS